MPGEQFSISAQYSLGGYPLSVGFETKALEALFNQSFGGFLSAGEGKPFATIPGHQLEIGYCDALPIPRKDQQLWYQGPLLNDGDCTLYSSGDRTLCLLGSEAALSTDYPQKKSRLDLLIGHESVVRQTLAINAFIDAAHTGGQFVIHAAALASPSRRELILIHAPSGTGKTTTSLVLMRAGFALASDDLVFILPESPTIAYGFPRSLKVHRNTAAMLPWVNSRLTETRWSPEGERSLPLANLVDFSPIVVPQPMPVSALIRLARTEGASRMVPIGQADMLATLAADNVRIGGAAGGLLPIYQDQFEAYGRLVKRCPLYELQAGSDLEELPGLFKRFA